MASLFSLANPVVYLVSARSGAERNGLIASWVTQATLAARRPRALAVISSDCRTNALIRESGRFALQLLEESQVELVGRFGIGTRPGVDKWEGLAVGSTRSGLPIVEGTCGYADCVVADRLDTGDRTVYVADIVEERVHAGRTPMRESDALSRQPGDVAKALCYSYELDVRRDDALLAGQLEEHGKRG